MGAGPRVGPLASAPVHFQRPILPSSPLPKPASSPSRRRGDLLGWLRGTGLRAPGSGSTLPSDELHAVWRWTPREASARQALSLRRTSCARDVPQGRWHRLPACAPRPGCPCHGVWCKGNGAARPWRRAPSPPPNADVFAEQGALGGGGRFAWESGPPQSLRSRRRSILICNNMLATAFALDGRGKRGL